MTYGVVPQWKRFNGKRFMLDDMFFYHHEALKRKKRIKKFYPHRNVRVVEMKVFIGIKNSKRVYTNKYGVYSTRR